MAWLLILGAVALAGYRYSLWRHPFRPCPRCKGRKGHNAAVFTGAYGNCWKCGGKGQFPRAGLKILAPSTYRAITSGQHGKNY